MHPNVQTRPRRVHGAEFKAKVLAQCREPQASIAAVALANGLNANLVRKWLAGRGLKRAVQAVDSTQPPRLTPATSPPPQLQFVPVAVTAPSHCNDATTGIVSQTAPADAAHIEVELQRGDACLAVRWPLSQSQACAAWLRELTGAVLK